MTDDAGDFIISDVPVANGYSIVISKDSYMVVWDTVDVTAGNITDLNSYDLASSYFLGNTGDSAYDIWLALRNAGSELDFITSLQGSNGVDGFNGTDGLSAFETWLALGNEGSELDFIMFLQGLDGIDGTNGTDGLSAFETWLTLGNEGSELDFIMSLQGLDGIDGTNGTDGLSAFEIWKALGNEGSELDFITSLQGSDGLDGTNGTAGLSAYEIWLALGYEGTEQDFIDSLTQDNNIVSAPCTFNNISEFYSTLDKVLLCPTPGATIIYTLDGTIPSENNGEIYIDGVVITESVTLKAIAIKEGSLNSSVSEFSFTKLPISDPVFSHTSGFYSERFDLEISNIDSIMDILVTVDGTDPSIENYIIKDKGSLSISIVGNKDIRAIVHYNGGYSNIISMEYTFPEVIADYVYKVSFNAELNDNFAPSATLIDNNGSLVGSFEGAIALGQVTTVNQLEGYYGNGSIRYIHDGVDSWGGIFAVGMTGVDFSNMGEVLVAVKGGFDPTMGAIELQLQGGNESMHGVNLLAYPSTASGEWVEYVVPLTEFISVEFDSFYGIFLLNPKSGTDIRFDGGHIATDVIVDFAFR